MTNRQTSRVGKQATHCFRPIVARLSQVTANRDSNEWSRRCLLLIIKTASNRQRRLEAARGGANDFDGRFNTPSRCHASFAPLDCSDEHRGGDGDNGTLEGRDFSDND